MHSRRSSVIVCLAVLGVLGCGGSGDEASRPGTVYRTNDFSFVLPSGWVETPERSSELEGDVPSAAAVAPEGTAPSSVVAVLSDHGRVRLDREVLPREVPSLSALHAAACAGAYDLVDEARARARARLCGRGRRRSRAQ